MELLLSSHAMIDHQNQVSFLISSSLTAPLPSQDGRTALMEASLKGRFLCVKLLLSHGATVDMKDHVLLLW